MGRSARGVRGMRLPEDEKGEARVVASMIVVDGDGDILTATAKRLRQAHRRSRSTRRRAAAPRA